MYARRYCILLPVELHMRFGPQHPPSQRKSKRPQMQVNGDSEAAEMNVVDGRAFKSSSSPSLRPQLRVNGAIEGNYYLRGCQFGSFLNERGTGAARPLGTRIDIFSDNAIAAMNGERVCFSTATSLGIPQDTKSSVGSPASLPSAVCEATVRCCKVGMAAVTLVSKVCLPVNVRAWTHQALCSHATVEQPKTSSQRQTVLGRNGEGRTRIVPAKDGLRMRLRRVLVCDD